MKRKLTVLIVVMAVVLFIIPAGAQNFTFEAEETYIYSTPAETTLVFHASVNNLTDEDITLQAQRTIIYSPHAWYSNMCFGYCYDNGISITDPTPIMANSSLDFELDVTITEGVVDYAEIQIRMINVINESEYVDITFIASTNPSGIDDNNNLQNSYVLCQNYPNPFNPETTIDYSLPASSNVEIAVFNSIGQKIKTLINKRESAGSHSVNWDATNSAGIKVPTGIYFYSLKAGEFSEMRKMVLLK